MAFIPVPGAAELVVAGSYLGQPLLNVFGFTKAAGGDFDPSDCNNLADAAVLAWQAGILPHLNNAYTVSEFRATDLSSATGPTVSVTPPSPYNGGFAGAPSPGQNALVITHRTLQRGRSFRGRTYMGGFSVGNFNGNDFNATDAAALLDGFDTFLEGMTGEGFTFVIISRQHDNVPRVTGVTTEVISSSIRDLRLDAQRRRTQG